VPLIDRIVGMTCWKTTSTGVYAAVKERLEDFVVEEVLSDGTILEINDPKLKPSGYEGLFTHFLLVKKGISNFEAIWIISKRLKIPLGHIFYSGNKDRDALTIQRMAIWGISPEDLLKLELPDKLKIFSPIRELRRVYVGEHKGNRFKIILRNIHDTAISNLLRILEEIRNDGCLPNFFGYQRFGIIRPITHIVGGLLSKKRYEDAIQIYLGAPGLIDDEIILEAKRLILEGDYQEALRLIPKKGFIFERIMLRGLLRYKNSEKILRTVPSFLLRMFIEAFQAYIFNLLLSRLTRDNISDINRMKNLDLPVIGFRTSLNNISEEIKSLVNEILSALGLNLISFKNNEFPPLSSKGTIRRAIMGIKFEKEQIIKSEGGNINLFLQFTLKKGEYATVIIREIVKEHILEAFLKHLDKKKGMVSYNMRRLLDMIKLFTPEIYDIILRWK